MAKRKHVQDSIIDPDPQVGKRYRRTMDMSDQTYKRLVRQAQRPPISFWIFIITIATSVMAVGILGISRVGITVETSGFLVVGLVLWILIIARMIRDWKERS